MYLGYKLTHGPKAVTEAGLVDIRTILSISLGSPIFRAQNSLCSPGGIQVEILLLQSCMYMPSSTNSFRSDYPVRGVILLTFTISGSETNFRLSRIPACTQSIHTYPSFTLTGKHTHTFSFFPEQARITALLVIVIIFGMVHKFSKFFKICSIFNFFFFFPNCEPFHIASLLQKSTCFLEIQIVIDKTNITYMNLNV